MKDQIEVPVLKAWKDVFDILKCAGNNPYNRGGFESCVLDFYKSRSAKSVFRGMAVPTLRNLGLILGYGEDIRASANGLLINLCHSFSKLEGNRALRVVLFELDSQIGFLEFIRINPLVSVEDFNSEWVHKVRISDSRTLHEPKKREKAARERVKDWLGFLAFSELIYNNDVQLAVDQNNLKSATIDADPIQVTKASRFETILITEYRKLVRHQNGVSTVEIEKLRGEVARNYFHSFKLVVTESQFDSLLIKVKKSTDEFLINFGRSMGAGEKLFEFRGKFFQTITIRFYNS